MPAGMIVEISKKDGGVTNNEGVNRDGGGGGVFNPLQTMRKSYSHFSFE